MRDVKRQIATWSVVVWLLAGVASAQTTIDLRDLPEDELELPVQRDIDIRPNDHRGPWPPPGRVYALPLTVTIQSVTRRETQFPTWDIELQVKNAGSESFMLPVAVDSRRQSVRPGNTGRREFSFAIEARTPSEARPISLGGATTEGSDSTPSSLLEIQPEETVLILLRVTGNARLYTWAESGVRTIDFRARISEERWADDRLSVERYTMSVYSDPVATTIEPF